MTRSARSFGVIAATSSAVIGELPIARRLDPSEQVVLSQLSGGADRMPLERSAWSMVQLPIKRSPETTYTGLGFPKTVTDPGGW